MAKLALAGIAAALVYFLLPLPAHHPAEANVVRGTWIGELRTHRWEGVAESLWLSIQARTDEEKYGYSFHVPLKDFEDLSIAPGHRGRTLDALKIGTRFSRPNR